MIDNISKSSPTPSDVHVGSAMGASRNEKIKRLKDGIVLVHKGIKKMQLEKANNFHDENGMFTSRSQAVHDSKLEAIRRRQREIQSLRRSNENLDAE